MSDEKKKEIILALNNGARFRDAARSQNVTIEELRRWRSEDPTFDLQVRNARATCKVNQLNRLSNAKGWQAPVFLLERKWPAEFGRRKPAAAPVEPEAVDHRLVDVDLSFLPPDQLKRRPTGFPRCHASR